MNEETGSSLLSFVVVGHVDHGKSTLVGKLLSEIGCLPEGKLDQVKRLCERNSKPFEYAFLLDTLRDEQSQGITIDTTRIFFKTQKRRYMILDAPGHIEFLKNMVTGAAKAEAAFLVIDAKEGIQENSKRHGLLLSLLGIKQVVVLVNKLDLLGYAEPSFLALRTEYEKYLRKLDVKPQGFIPISAYHGDNLSQRSEKMPWYKGPTVLEAIDAFEGVPDISKLPFRMPVQDVYRFTKGGDDRRIVAGTVESGTLAPNETVIFYPSERKIRIRQFETFPEQPAPTGLPDRNKLPFSTGDAAGFSLHDQVYIPRGEIACKEHEPAPEISSRFEATVFWLGKTPLVPGKKYVLKLGTVRCEAWLNEIRRVLNTIELTYASNEEVGQNEVAECVFDLDRPIAFEVRDRHPTLSRFVLFDGYDLSGGGIIRCSLKDTQFGIKEQFRIRDLKWETSLIPSGNRTAKNGHPASLILITGEKNAARKEIAKSLEEKLFESGHSVYYLGFGSLLYGMRSLSEIAHLFLNAGMILVVSAQEFSQSELDAIRLGLLGATVRTIWIGDLLTSDLLLDLQIRNTDERQVALDIFEYLRNEGLTRKF